MTEHRLYNDVLAVAVTDGSVTVNTDGGVSLCWRNDTGGRSTLSTLYNEDADYVIERATEMGVLIVDYRGCEFEKVAKWVISGPMMRELFEPEPDKNDELAEMVLGPAFRKLDAFEYCTQAVRHTGCKVVNMPAPKGWRKVEA